MANGATFAAVSADNTIELVLKEINSTEKDGIFLPYIQRDFVWDVERIYALLDSLMRGYPMGVLLLWTTDNPINYRPFAKDYDQEDNEYDFKQGDSSISRRYVLDGQQRLQSLYIAMYGSYDGGELYFNLRSSPEDDDGKYVFKFMRKAPKSPEWLNVPKFLSRDFKSAASIGTELKRDGTIPMDFLLQDRMIENATELYNVFKAYHNIPIQNLTNDIPLNDIAEIFVRTNSGGVVLEKADLLMATIQGNWLGAGEAFSELGNTILTMGYANPKDFILRACLAMLCQEPGLGKKGLAILNTPEFQKKIEENFPALSDAIFDVLRFISELGIIRGSKIPYYNPILILACYRYHHKDAWGQQQDRVRAFFFTAFLSGALVKPTGKLMKELLGYAVKSDAFSLSIMQKISRDNGKDLNVNVDALLDIKMSDPIADLVLYLIYYGQRGYRPEMTEKDHIFPVSALRKAKSKGKSMFLAKDYDSIVNCELLSQEDNLAKGDQLPKQYFSNLGKSLKAFVALHEIPSPKPGEVDIWEIRFFGEFLQERRAGLKERIAKNFNGLDKPLDIKKSGNFLKRLFSRKK